MGGQMKIKILILLLIIPLTVYAGPLQDKHKKVVAVLSTAGDSGPNCDGAAHLAGQDDVESSSGSMGSTGRWKAYKLLAADTDAGTAGCVKIYVTDDNDDSSENFGIAVYSHDSGNDRPNTEIASAAFTGHDFTGTGDSAIHSFIMDATFELTDATDYWVAIFCDNQSITIEKATVDTHEARYGTTGQSYDSPPAGSYFTSSLGDTRYGISLW